MPVKQRAVDQENEVYALLRGCDEERLNPDEELAINYGGRSKKEIFWGIGVAYFEESRLETQALAQEEGIHSAFRIFEEGDLDIDKVLECLGESKREIFTDLENRYVAESELEPNPVAREKKMSQASAAFRQGGVKPPSMDPK